MHFLKVLFPVIGFPKYFQMEVIYLPPVKKVFFQSTARVLAGQWKELLGPMIGQQVNQLTFMKLEEYSMFQFGEGELHAGTW